VLILRALLRLTRIDSSLLGFLAIFLPLVVRSNDLAFSFGKAVPLLLICGCTFIANDLDDVERDQVNHPDRPLPAHQLTTTIAVMLYFTFLGSALFLTRHFVGPRIAFWYYALIALSVSYGYIGEWLPSLKAPYVGVASSTPVLIVMAFYPNERRLYVVAGSVFLLTLGRELCMNIKDRAGDAVSFMNTFRPRQLAVAAFSFQTMGLILLAIQIRNLGGGADLLAMTFLLGLSAVCWFKLAHYRAAIFLMKLQFFVGLYFLT
jgi:geranylgeranylglycerol-phosphate geranylgeranyltransferase